MDELKQSMKEIDKELKEIMEAVEQEGFYEFPDGKCRIMTDYSMSPKHREKSDTQVFNEIIKTGDKNGGVF